MLPGTWEPGRDGRNRPGRPPILGLPITASPSTGAGRRGRRWARPPPGAGQRAAADRPAVRADPQPAGRDRLPGGGGRRRRQRDLRRRQGPRRVRAPARAGPGRTRGRAGGPGRPLAGGPAGHRAGRPQPRAGGGAAAGRRQRRGALGLPGPAARVGAAVGRGAGGDAAGRHPGDGALRPRPGPGGQAQPPGRSGRGRPPQRPLAAVRPRPVRPVRRGQRAAVATGSG